MDFLKRLSREFMKRTPLTRKGFKQKKHHSRDFYESRVIRCNSNGLDNQDIKFERL